MKLGQNRESKRFSLLPVVFLTFLVINFNLHNKLILLRVSAYAKRNLLTREDDEIMVSNKNY